MINRALDNKPIKPNNKGEQLTYISYKYRGNRVFYDIFDSTEFDYKVFTPKKHCKLFRILEPVTGIMPIISLNIERSLIYFLTDFDTEVSNWETRGVKLDFPINHFFDN